MRRIVLLSLACLLLSLVELKAQSYELRYAAQFAGNDTMLLDVFIQRPVASPAFNLGSANIVFELDATCLDVSRATIRAGSENLAYSLPANGYNPMTVVGTGNRVNLSIFYTGGPDPMNPLPGTIVPVTALAPLARIAIPITGCNCTVVPTVNALLNIVRRIVSIGPPVLQAIIPPPASWVGTPLAMNQPSVSSGPASVNVCGPGQISTYTSSTAGFWRIQSTVGSTIITDPINRNSIDVLHGQPAGLPSTDIITVSPTQTSVCVQADTTVLNPPPLVNFNLGIVGSATVCSGQGFQLQLSGSEAGVTYQLLRNDTAIGTPITSMAGGPLLFTVPALPLRSAPGYDFTYRAVRGLCTVEQVPPGVEVQVVNCTLPTVIAGPSALTQCGNSTASFSLQGAPLVGALLTWQVLNRATPPVVQIVGSNYEPNVNVNLGRSLATQTDTLVLTQTLGAASGRDSVFITVRRAANPEVGGPSFLFRATPVPGTVTGNFFVPTGAPDFILNATSTYTWSNIPALSPAEISVVLSGAQNEFADITFSVDGIFDIIVTEVTSDGCARQASRRVQVTDCNANPGTSGPNQTVCIGQNSLVYVENDLFAAPGGLQWQQSTSSTGPWVNVTGGFGATSQVYFTPPLMVTTYYRLRASNLGFSCSNFSLPIEVQAVAPPVAGIVTPRDTGVCEQGVVTLRANGGGGAILWQQSTNGLDWVPAAGLGITTPVFQSVPLTNSLNYRALFGNGCDSVASNAVRITINSTPTGFATQPLPPNDAICAGSTSDSLVATVTSPNSIGFWTTNGAGAVNASNRYVSTLDDTLRTTPVTLAWVITSGNCTPVIDNIQLQVDGPPRGTFAPITPSTICAGSPTDTLNATLIRGTGQWSIQGDPMGTLGFFVPNSVSPRARYVSSSAAAGSTVTLVWTVTSGACGTQTYSRQVNVSSNVIGGTFPALTSPIICFGDTTAPLNASNVMGTTAFWSTTGTGVFIPGPGAPNARYIPSASDQGTTVRLIWNITRPACTPLVLTQDLDVRRRPRAVILNQQADVACFTTPYVLSSIALNGTGAWSIQQTDAGPAPGGSFVPSNADPGASYVAAPSDTNRSFRIRWTVTGSGAVCDPDTAQMILTVFGEPRGTFGTAVPDICAGSSTIPLGATVVAGQRGVWRTPNGGGTFSDSLNPNAFYNSDLTDANQNIVLRWRVISDGCGTRDYDQTVFVNPSTIIGDWPGAPLPLPAQCFNVPTAPLGASVTLPSTAIWESDGAGSFIPSATAPNAQYVPSPLDRGDTLTLTWRISNPPCNQRVLTRRLIVRDTVNAIFPVPPSVCFPNPSDTLGARITGDPQATGSWSIIASSDAGYVGGGAFTPNSSNRNARYIPVAGDVGRRVRLLWTAINGVCANDTISRELRVVGASSVIITPSMQTICQGDTATVTASGAEFYFWSGPGIIGSTTNDTVRSVPATTGAPYSVQLQLLAGTASCTFPPLLATIQANPGLPVTATQITPPAMGTVCVGSSAQLAVTGPLQLGGEISWRRDDGQPFSTGEISNPNVANPLVFPTGDRTYRVRARTINGCFGEATVSVATVVNTPPALPDTLLTCLYDLGSDSVRLTAIYGSPAPVPGEVVYWFSTSRNVLTTLYPTGLPSTADPTFIDSGRVVDIAVPAPGVYPYTVFYFNGACPSYTTTNLQVIPAPDAEFSADRTVLPFFDPVVNFSDSSSGAVAYFWNFGDTASAFNVSVEQNPQHRYSSSGRYSVVLLVTNALDCPDLEVKSGYISVLPERYDFPKVFSPDGQLITTVPPGVDPLDSPPWINERLRPLPLRGEPCVELLEIYSKTGTLLYSFAPPEPVIFPLTDENFGWDGRDGAGNLLDPGAYSYKVVVRTKVNDLCTGQKQTYTGSITLVR